MILCTGNRSLGLGLRDPNNPMQVIFTDFRAQCRQYLYTWIPRVCEPCSGDCFCGCWGVLVISHFGPFLGLLYVSEQHQT